MASRANPAGRLLKLVAGLAMLFGAALVVRHLASPVLPSGAVDVAWDREACAHCRMHVGDPRYAAQLQTKSGEVLNFDDPGCLLERLRQGKDDVHAIYFHSASSDRWIPAAEVRFATGERTPMGYGLAATDEADGRASLLDFDAAFQRVSEMRAEVKQ